MTEKKEYNNGVEKHKSIKLYEGDTINEEIIDFDKVIYGEIGNIPDYVSDIIEKSNKLEYYVSNFNCDMGLILVEELLELDIDSDNRRLILSKGYFLENMGKHKEALECYKLCIKSLNASVGIIVKLVSLCFKNGDYIGGLEISNLGLLTYKNNIPLLELKSEAELNLLKYGDSLNTTNKSINIIKSKKKVNNDKLEYLYRNKADRLYKLGLGNEALDIINDCLRFNLKAGITWYLKGLIHKKLGKVNYINCYKMSLGCKIDSDINYEEVGNDFYEKGLFIESIISYKNNLELNKNDYSIYNKIGLCYERLGKYDESEEAYEKSIELNAKQSPSNDEGIGNYILNKLSNDRGNNFEGLEDF